jgi:predicted Holliday junction resolvase-like endonuclease
MSAFIVVLLIAIVIIVFMHDHRLQQEVNKYKEEAQKISLELVRQEGKESSASELLQELNRTKEELRTTSSHLTAQQVENSSIFDSANQLIDEVNRLKIELQVEKDNNMKILSQKKSSEVRLGGIGESLVPFLEGFKYDPSTARFLGMPLDYIIFDLYSSDPAIVFMEVKTGGSQLTPTQKLIKKLVKQGAVRFEEFRIGEKGIKIKTTFNDDEDKE